MMKLRPEAMILWLVLLGGVMTILLLRHWHLADRSIQTTDATTTTTITAASFSPTSTGRLRSSSRPKQKVGHRNFSLTLWSTDFHISPIADVKALLTQTMGVKVIDKSLSGHCHLTNTCASDLRVLNKDNGIALNPCPNTLIRDFYNSYRNDKEFLAADAILCQHATSLCELYMPFGKPIIVIASTRYEIGRHSIHRWKRWNDNLHRIASNPYNTIAANNRYDLEYVKYFTSLVEGTGEKSIQLLPNYCDYVNTVYRPGVSKPVLLAPARGVNPVLVRQLYDALAKFNAKFDWSTTPLTGTTEKTSTTTPMGTMMINGLRNKRTNTARTAAKGLEIVGIRDLYPQHYEYSDLSSHPAIIFLPYQVSIMSLFEYYRMGIPLFVPSVKLLTKWHRQYRVLNERTWMSVFGTPVDHSPLPRHDASNCSLSTDPNNDYSDKAVHEWIALSDFYQWPYITQFDSFEDVFTLLTPLDSEIVRDRLKDISKKMLIFNEEEKHNIAWKWVEILEKIQRYRLHEKGEKKVDEVLPEDVNDALEKFYGYRLGNDCESDATKMIQL